MDNEKFISYFIDNTFVSVMRSASLMLFKEVICVYSDSRVNINTLSGQCTELLTLNGAFNFTSACRDKFTLNH